MTASLADILNQRIAGRIAVVSPSDYGDMLFPVEAGRLVPEEVQRRCWRDGRFYVLAGTVTANDAWQVEDAPSSEEADRIERAYGLPVMQMFRRDPRYPFPAEPAPAAFDFG